MAALTAFRPDLRERYGPWALVAGASEGIGAAFAHALAAHGFKVVVVARREDKLQAFAEELRQAHGTEVLALPLDLARPDLLEALDAGLDGRELGLVVYNACATHIGPFLEMPADKVDLMLAVNCRGPALMAHHLGAKMAARGRGGLVLMSSTSGFQGSAMVGVYGATKAFDTALGEVLWEELGRHGVDVLVCAAGATRTPNFQAATPADKQDGAFPMDPEDVARQTLDALGRSGPTFVPGWLNRAVVFLTTRVMSRRGAVRFMSKNTRRIYHRPARSSEPAP